MGLYLCVFDDGDAEEPEELDGVEVGSYADFGFFRATVTRLLENGDAGSKYPTLILHHDSDGEWTPTECRALKVELRSIAKELANLPAIPFRAEWQCKVADSVGLRPDSLYDSFIDVDGEPLLERLEVLCDVAIGRDVPILFQ